MFKSRKRLRAWKDAAASCGLQVVESHPGWRPWLKAKERLVEARIGVFAIELTRIVIEAPWPPEFHHVTIRPESTNQPPEIEVGDQRFDDIFYVSGPSQLVFALLDAETRQLLFHAIVNGRLEISHGKLQMVQRDERVPDTLPILIDIGRRLARPMDIPRRLAENAHQEPIPWVRLQNLRLLIRELPENPATAEALRKACSDSNPEIRLCAAREMGVEGRATLRELAERVENDAVSAEAFSLLERELPFDRMRAILYRASSQSRLRTAHVCLEAIGRSGHPAAVGTLARVLEGEHRELFPMAAWALGATGSPAAEPALIEILQHEDQDVRVAAVNALGRVGSVAAVLPLKEMAGGFLLGPIRGATRQAVAEIQSRLEGASPGQLSLAGAEAGQLSLAVDPAGQLSLGEDD